MQPWEFDVSRLAAAYRARDLTPSEMVTATLERIDRLDGVVGAFRSVLADQALAAAAESDRRVTDDPRPLEGVPVAIKELFDVAGADGTYGSALRAGQVHAADAEAVRRLRQAGAIVVGTTRSHEFGWGITTQHATLGSTANPWDTTRVPGGSSGGSAAALATGMVPLALGSDTGGSIRIPAAFCGVVGLKPTYGRVPKIGAVSLAPSLDHPGPMARTVADAAAALEVLAGPHPADPSSRRHPMAAPKARPLVGVCFDLHLVDPAPDHAAAFESTVAALSDAGFDVVEVRFPMAADIRPAFATIQMAEAHHVHNRVLATFPDRADEYGPDVRGRLEAAAEVGLADYLEARATAAAVTAAFAELFAERCDVLVTPVSAGPPAHRADPDTVTHLGAPLALRDLVMGFTVPQDLAGLPAVAVPVGFDDAGLPVGMQFTAWHDEERTAAAVAATVSRDLGWPRVAEGGSIA